MLEAKGFRLAVFTVLGRQYLNLKADCPAFCGGGTNFAPLAGQADGFFVEVHAEATSEKQALGWHLDGRALAVVGTHTHVPTADVFSASAAGRHGVPVLDAGMTGPYASVLGRAVKPVIGRFLRRGCCVKFDVAEGDVRLSAALVGIRSRDETRDQVRIGDRAGSSVSCEAIRRQRRRK